jgi:hypothetical protein
MHFHGNFFIKHKYWEFEFLREKTYWQWFEIHFNFDRNVDHPGFHLRLDILGFNINLDIYDHRHWDFEKDSWDLCDCD